MTRLAPLLLLAAAAVAAPPAPETYHVKIRYSIDALQTERVRQYDEMLRAFRGAGFEREDEPGENEALDRAATRMTGTVPALGVPRLSTERHVRSLLLWPKGTKIPAGDARVRVDVYLASGFLADTQLKVHRQTAQALAKAGFVEAFGYDQEGASKLVGSMPSSKLDLALEDPRKIPDTGAIGAPFRNIQAIKAIIARPDFPVPSARPSAPVVPPDQDKYSPELRALLAAGGATQGRLEVILDHTPGAFDNSWMQPLRVGGAVIEGRIGPLVSVAGVPKAMAPELAKVPSVLAVRVPRRASRAPTLKTDVPADWSPLRRSGLAQLHSMHRRGKGTRVAVIADDFTGWQKLPGVKEGVVRHVDLTALRDKELEPDPAGTGMGTRYARSVIEAAPEAEVMLLRVPADAPYMVENLARAINGEAARSYLLNQRMQELSRDREILALRRDEVNRLRSIYLDDPREDEEGLKRRKEFDDADAAYKKLEAGVRKRSARWFALERDLLSLKGVRVVASTLVWTDGFPVDGSSALSRYFDDQPFKAALWFQAAGDTRGQSWSGLFRDANGNDFMEVYDAGKRLPKGAWTPEIAWLSWEGADGKVTSSSAGGDLRVVLQWKEAHDPLPLQNGEDPYRVPLAKMRIVVVRQFDPDGAKRPEDDLEVVAQSVGTPIRLEQTLRAATYEATLELRLPGPGRYGVMVEGEIPESTSPPGEATIPATRRRVEIRPRLFVEAPGTGARPVFSHLPPNTAAFGVPADARRVITVGAADTKGDARADSAQGSPYGADLVSRPDLLAFGPAGTGEAACFAAGMAAVTANAKGSFGAFLEAVRDRRGSLLRAPGTR